MTTRKKLCDMSESELSERAIRRKLLARERNRKYLEKTKDSKKEDRKLANQKYLTKIKTDPTFEDILMKRKESARKRSSVWYYENKEYANLRNSKYSKEWDKKFPHLSNAKTQRRNAAKILATPNWANYEKIKEIYKEASELTKSSGIMHHVDHIIPLRSKYVCGLHVETNLRIVPWHVNLSKGNKILENI